jgi:hypothetical protein
MQQAVTSYEGLVALARSQGGVSSEARGSCKLCGGIGHLTKQVRAYAGRRLRDTQTTAQAGTAKHCDAKKQRLYAAHCSAGSICCCVLSVDAMDRVTLIDSAPGVTSVSRALRTHTECHGWGHSHPSPLLPIVTLDICS